KVGVAPGRDVVLDAVFLPLMHDHHRLLVGIADILALVTDSVQTLEGKAVPRLPVPAGELLEVLREVRNGVRTAGPFDAVAKAFQKAADTARAVEVSDAQAAPGPLLFRIAAVAG